MQAIFSISETLVMGAKKIWWSPEKIGENNDCSRFACFVATIVASLFGEWLWQAL
jgi:hypothetical protein